MKFKIEQWLVEHKAKQTTAIKSLNETVNNTKEVEFTV